MTLRFHIELLHLIIHVTWLWNLDFWDVTRGYGFKNLCLAGKMEL